MNIKPLLIVLFVFSFSLTNAQEFGIGLKGGVNYNYIGDFKSVGSNSSLGSFSADNEIGYQFGVFVDIGFDRFFVRPEANYVSLKNSYAFPTKVSNWASQQIDIPILFGYKIYYPVAIYAGPVFSFISDMTMEGMKDSSYSEPFTYNTSSAGISAGILLDFDRVGIDFRYKYGITTVKEQRIVMIKNYNGYGVDIGDLLEYNPSQIMVNIQVKLFTVNSGERYRRSKSDWRNHKNL